MTVSVFVGISVDGFITRPNGDLDFPLAGRLALCVGSDWALGVTFPPSERRGVSCCGT